MQTLSHIKRNPTRVNLYSEANAQQKPVLNRPFVLRLGNVCLITNGVGESRPLVSFPYHNLNQCQVSDRLGVLVFVTPYVVAS